VKRTTSGCCSNESNLMYCTHNHQCRDCVQTSLGRSVNDAAGKALGASLAIGLGSGRGTATVDI
jgi:hypothetical protein